MRNIVLIGFMGTGKSCVGRLLASRLRRPFIDTDKKIEVENGMPIPTMFANYGEAYFRSKERGVIARVSRYTNTVISTGGGVVLSEENMKRLRSYSIVLALTASVDTVLERTSRRNNRPLLNRSDRRQAVEKLMNERLPLYNKADYVIDTTNNSPHEIVDIIISHLREGGYLRG